jgi:hypothetical protein
MNVVSVITGIVTAIAGIAGIIVGIIKTLKNNENANNIPQGGNAGGPMPYPTHAQVYQAAHQQPQQVVNGPAPVMQQYQAPVFPQYQMPYQAPVVRQTYYGPSMNTIEWPVPQMFNDAPMFQNWAYNYPSNGTTAWSQPANHQNNFPVIDTSVVDEMVNTMNRSRYVGNARPV